MPLIDAANLDELAAVYATALGGARRLDALQDRASTLTVIKVTGELVWAKGFGVLPRL
jgi:hypothetical protein